MFADLKNDFVFRRIFAHHAELTQALLNDLLALEGPERIVELTLLPPEQAPVVMGAKLSILDLKARDQGGRNFVVEMQLLHVAGFLNRVVYNACKTYVGQLQAGKPYTGLRDVLAVSLCDFVIWPPPEGATPVPLVSRWVLTEEQSGTKDLRQVQYVFVELPKLPRETMPRSTAEQWAWLFKYGEEKGLRKGKKLGLDEGKRLGLQEAILDLCEAYGVEVTEERKTSLNGLDRSGLEGLRVALKARKTWPQLG